MPQGQTNCHGNGADHCCYWNGEPCPYLEQDTIPGRRWVCGLMRELGDWDLVHEDPRYLNDVQPLWRDEDPLWDWLWQQGVRCGTWGVEGKGQGSMASAIKVPGNAPQWQKDFQTACIEGWQAAQNGEYVPFLCCFGNEPEV